jgi:hypothetical protein
MPADNESDPQTPDPGGDGGDDSGQNDAGNDRHEHHGRFDHLDAREDRLQERASCSLENERHALGSLHNELSRDSLSDRATAAGGMNSQRSLFEGLQSASLEGTPSKESPGRKSSGLEGTAERCGSQPAETRWEKAVAQLKYAGEYAADFAAGTADFVRNFNEMQKSRVIGHDQYAHCMANCESAERGPGGVLAAEFMSKARESLWTVKDMAPKAIGGKGMTWAQSKEDSLRDHVVNRAGREAAASGTRCSEGCQRYKPRGL